MKKIILLLLAVLPLVAQSQSTGWTYDQIKEVLDKTGITYKTDYSNDSQLLYYYQAEKDPASEDLEKTYVFYENVCVLIVWNLKTWEAAKIYYDLIRDDPKMKFLRYGDRGSIGIYKFSGENSKKALFELREQDQELRNGGTYGQVWIYDEGSMFDIR